MTLIQKQAVIFVTLRLENRRVIVYNMYIQYHYAGVRYGYFAEYKISGWICKTT